MNKSGKNFWIIFLITLSVPVLYLVFYVYVSQQSSDNFQKIGNWGQSFTALGTLFSGLAFLAVGITIYLQIQNNKEQDVFNREQININRRQLFFTSFFHLLSLFDEKKKQLLVGLQSTYLNELIEQKKTHATNHHKMDKSLLLEEKIRDYNFQRILEDIFINKIPLMQGAIKTDGSSHSQKIWASACDVEFVQIYNRYCLYFAPYYSTLDVLITRIEKNHDAEFYKSTLMAQLDNYERIVIAILAASHKNRKIWDFISQSDVTYATEMLSSYRNVHHYLEIVSQHSSKDQ